MTISNFAFRAAERLPASPLHFPAGLSPNSVAAADFNRDGNLDLAAASSVQRDSAISILTQRPPNVGTDPGRLDFGGQRTGKRSKSRRLTITNLGGPVLRINSLTPSGDFTLKHNACGGAALAEAQAAPPA